MGMLIENAVREELNAFHCLAFEAFECETLSRSYENCIPVEEQLKYWDSSKSSYLYKMFGEELILRKEINVSMSEEQIIEELYSNVLNWGCPGNEFLESYRKKVINSCLDSNNYDSHKAMITASLISDTCLSKNIYDREDFILTAPNGDSVQIHTGCKVIKTLKKIAKVFDLDGFEEFRIAHSQATNQKRMKGELCLSIHYLDYATMSINDCGWSSCMNWLDCDGGEYRRGVIEMMNSPMVIVAYFNAKNPMTLFGTKVSNKRWRQLFIVNKDIIAGVKQYPYYNEEMERTVLNWLKELAETNLGWKYREEIIEFENGEDFTLSDETKCSVCFCTNDMYNDFNSKSKSFGYISAETDGRIWHNYSGVANCLMCGMTGNFPDDEHSLVCEDCGDNLRCACCGDHLWDDMRYELDGEDYCECCYEDLAKECPICGGVHHHDNCSNRIYLALPDSNGKYHLYRRLFINACDDCLAYFYKWNDYFNITTPRKLPDNAYGAWFSSFVFLEECKDSGADAYADVADEEYGVKDLVGDYLDNEANWLCSIQRDEN